MTLPRDAEHDAHLRAALRHAPDRDAAAPELLSARILARAHTAVDAAAPRENVLARWFAWLARPSAAGALGSVLLAGVIAVMWREGPPPEALPGGEHSAAREAPAVATAPMPAQAPPVPTAAQAPAPVAAQAPAAAPMVAQAPQTAPMVAPAPPPAQAPEPAVTRVEPAPPRTALPVPVRPPPPDIDVKVRRAPAKADAARDEPAPPRVESRSENVAAAPPPAAIAAPGADPRRAAEPEAETPRRRGMTPTPQESAAPRGPAAFPAAAPTPQTAPPATTGAAGSLAAERAATATARKSADAGAQDTAALDKPRQRSGSAEDPLATALAAMARADPADVPSTARRARVEALRESLRGRWHRIAVTEVGEGGERIADAEGRPLGRLLVEAGRVTWVSGGIAWQAELPAPAPAAPR